MSTLKFQKFRYNTKSFLISILLSIAPVLQNIMLCDKKFIDLIQFMYRQEKQLSIFRPNIWLCDLVFSA